LRKFKQKKYFTKGKFNRRSVIFAKKVPRRRSTQNNQENYPLVLFATI
jgi:hypothetical protein